MHQDCIFCKIVAGVIPCFKIYEDEHTLAFMDINPVNPGHCLVVPKNHAPNLFESDDADLARTMAVVRKISRAVQKALNPYGLNLLQANGPGAAQSVFHLHLHIIPRERDDDLRMNWGLKSGNKDEIAAVAEKIKEALED
ncbi:HIT family hydrolase, diadenosine tetraphosphate hydrolase [Rhodospirillaceae bacterium LM-1]|nr:HIT family hydrolase, diadenosine tetraphosphate hydrolase [Rhodospirillaceae bacterium LM-1]